MGKNRRYGTLDDLFHDKRILKIVAFSLLASMLLAGAAAVVLPQNAFAANTLTVKGTSLDGKSLNMWTTISTGGSTAKSGFTPLSFAGATGATYTITVSDYGSMVFDHWGDGSTARAKTLTLNADSTLTAYYRSTAPPNRNPIAVDDSVSANQSRSLLVNVLANDSDPDGDVLNVTSVSAPAYGSAMINSNDTITYTPPSGFSGTDSFSYAISDGNGGAATGTVAVTVKAPPTMYVLTIGSADMYGKATSGLYTTIKQGSTTVKTGFTTVAFTGTGGATYSVAVSDYGSSFFDHWDDGSTLRTRTITLNADTTITALFRVPTLVISPTGGVGGTSITATGTYFSPNSAVTITYGGSQMGSTTTTSTGSFTYTFAAPSLGTGIYSVQATDGKGWKASASFQDVSQPQPYTMNNLLPKTGVYVPLYMYPSGTGATWWQQVIDTKNAHPSVPIVATFNPSSGPATSQDSNVVSWVAKLRNAGVVVLGYTHDSYGARSLTDLKADADRYKNWYNADGLFIDEFTNKAGYETHYSNITSYVKSIGMKMTFGNPGTDVPKSYVGTVDIINITEGSGYMPISWLQYCVLCTPDQGWHYQYDKRYFAYMRYGISSLDTSFETESAKWVGLLYLTDGTDSNGRWFNLPSYFGTLVATLDK
jgi:hypothetical protein